MATLVVRTRKMKERTLGPTTLIDNSCMRSASSECGLQLLSTRLSSKNPPEDQRFKCRAAAAAWSQSKKEMDHS